MDKKEWDEVTEEDMMEMCYDENLIDAEIAKKYGVTKNQVAYKRRRFGVNLMGKAKKKIIEDTNNKPIFDKISCFEILIDAGNRKNVGRACVQYLLENSTIDSDLNESPKKQEMYARMETLLEALEHGKIEWLRSIVSKYSKEN